MVGPIEDTLASVIRHGLSLEITCPKCDRKVIVDPRLAARKVSPKTSIHHLPIYCKICNSRQYRASAYPSDWK
jgi:hypothetical protein